MSEPPLNLTRKADGWWITGLDDDCGPYATRADADDDRRGLIRFFRFENDPEFVSGPKWLRNRHNTEARPRDS